MNENETEEEKNAKSKSPPRLSLLWNEHMCFVVRYCAIDLFSHRFSYSKLEPHLFFSLWTRTGCCFLFFDVGTGHTVDHILVSGLTIWKTASIKANGINYNQLANALRMMMHIPHTHAHTHAAPAYAHSERIHNNNNNKNMLNKRNKSFGFMIGTQINTFWLNASLLDGIL